MIMISSVLLSGAMGLLGTGINHISNAFNRNRQESREDSTYQRTLEDMREAGLSPMAMSGTDSSTPITPSTEGTDLVSQMNGTLSTLSNIAKVGAEIENTNAMTKGIVIDNDGKLKNQKYLDTNYEGSSLKYEVDTDWKKKVSEALSKIANKYVDGLLSTETPSDEKSANNDPSGNPSLNSPVEDENGDNVSYSDIMDLQKKLFKNQAHKQDFMQKYGKEIKEHHFRTDGGKTDGVTKSDLQWLYNTMKEYEKTIYTY